MSTFEPVSLGHIDLRVTPICLATMYFGEQVEQAARPGMRERVVR